MERVSCAIIEWNNGFTGFINISMLVVEFNRRNSFREIFSIIILQRYRFVAIYINKAELGSYIYNSYAVAEINDIIVLQRYNLFAGLVDTSKFFIVSANAGPAFVKIINDLIFDGRDFLSAFINKSPKAIDFDSGPTFTEFGDSVIYRMNDNFTVLGLKAIFIAGFIAYRNESVAVSGANVISSA